MALQRHEPAIFIERLHDAVTVTHFKVGMIKAPFMALVIGVVACTEGLQVKGSAKSLGLQTTTSVGEVDLPWSSFWTAFSRFSSQALGCKMSGEHRLLSLQYAISPWALGRSGPRRAVAGGLPRRILGVVGGSGAGKSVLMRTIIGLQPRWAAASKSSERTRINRAKKSSGPFSGAGAFFSSKAPCSRR